jgi:hypothetical protein
MKTHDTLSIKAEFKWMDDNENKNTGIWEFEDLSTAKLFGQSWAEFIHHGVVMTVKNVSHDPFFFTPKCKKEYRYVLGMQRLGGCDEGYLIRNMGNKN